jgi:hypothetical protein
LLNYFIVTIALMNLGDYIPEDKQGMFSFGNTTELMRIFYQLYKEAIKKSTNSIYIACHEVSVLMQGNGEYIAKITNMPLYYSLDCDLFIL